MQEASFLTNDYKVGVLNIFKANSSILYHNQMMVTFSCYENDIYIKN